MPKALNTASIKNNKNWVFWIALFVLFCIFLHVLKPVLLPFVTGILIGYLFDPLTTKIKRVIKNRTLAALIVILALVVILVPSFILLISIINEQLTKFIGVVPGYITMLFDKLQPILLDLQDKFPDLSAEKIKESLHSNAGSGLKIITSVTRKIISSGFAIFNLLSLLIITPVVAFYMLRDWKPFVKKMDSLLPRKEKDTIRKVALQIDKTIAGFIRGQLSVCLVLGTFYATGLSIIGLELGFLIGFIAGLISFMPYIGSITGFVIGMGIALAQFDSITPAIWVAIIFATGSLLESYFLTPKLIGESIGLHPVWIMFALLAGGMLLGFLGLMIAVPIAAVIGVLIRFAIENYKKSELYLG